MKKLSHYFKFFVAILFMSLTSCSSTDGEEQLFLDENASVTEEIINYDELSYKWPTGTSVLNGYDEPDSCMDVSYWKINYPVNSNFELSGNSDSYENKNIETAGVYPYFYGWKGKYVFFEAPYNGATTSGSGNVRSELRERSYTTTGSRVDALWDSSGNTVSQLEFQCYVDVLPSTSRLTFVQIHDKDSTLDDVIQIGIKPNPNANNALYVTIQGSILTGSGENSQYQYLYPYTLTNLIHLRIKTFNNLVWVYKKVGSKWSRVFAKSIKDKWPNETLDREYFKAGCYLQGYPTSGKGKVSFKYLKITH